MKYLLVVGAIISVVACAEPLLPSCRYPVYCDSDILHHVQMARVFPDSKTFVDYHMRSDPNDTLAAFQQLLNQTNNAPSKEHLTQFVHQHFTNDSELEDWTPNDYNENPVFLSTIRDEQLRQFGKDVNNIWPILGRKIKSNVFQNPERYSIIPVSNGFIIPGGRFKELYYWDAYWIVEGLLITGMKDTTKGMLNNFVELLNTVGLIPNGGRWYYEKRSQPPLFTAMMSLYIRYTSDIDFLKQHIDALEAEMNFWLDNRITTVNKNGKSYTLLRYYALSAGPRPESYYEDYTSSLYFNTTESRQDFYVELKSAAESGWDFSARWFIDADGDNTGHLTNLRTVDIIPVDLNAIFANALQNVAYFRSILGQPRIAARWGALARLWRNNIEQVLWNEEVGVWLDYDVANQKHRNYFYPTNLSPLWMETVTKKDMNKHAPRIIQYMHNSGALNYRGGLPASLLRTGEQWDFPNSWPPLVSMAVNAMKALNTEESKLIAFQLAQDYVRACHKGFQEHKQMFEKYDSENPGQYGGGGEYTVQEGFGWSNGVVFEFLAMYGREMTANDSLDDSENGTDPAASSHQSIPIQKAP